MKRINCLLFTLCLGIEKRQKTLPKATRLDIVENDTSILFNKINSISADLDKIVSILETYTKILEKRNGG